MTRPGIILCLGILSFLSMCIAAWPVSKVKKKLQNAAVCNVIGCAFMIGCHLATYLEGYFGIGCAVPMAGFMFFLVSAFGFIVAAIFRPVLAASGLTASRSVVLFWVQSVGFSTVAFFRLDHCIPCSTCGGLECIQSENPHSCLECPILLLLPHGTADSRCRPKVPECYTVYIEQRDGNKWRSQQEYSWTGKINDNPTQPRHLASGSDHSCGYI